MMRSNRIFRYILVFIFLCGYGVAYAQRAAEIPTEVIEKNVTQKPNDYVVRVVTGFHYFDTGKYEKAVKHFTKVVEMKPKDPYGRAWLYMAEIRADSKASGKSLHDFLKENPSGEFIDTAMKVLLGEVSPEESVKVATAGKELGDLFEANYYSAQKLLADGKSKKSLKYLSAALKTDQQDLWEYQSAIAHFKLNHIYTDLKSFVVNGWEVKEVDYGLHFFTKSQIKNAEGKMINSITLDVEADETNADMTIEKAVQENVKNILKTIEINPKYEPSFPVPNAKGMGATIVEMNDLKVGIIEYEVPSDKMILARHGLILKNRKLYTFTMIFFDPEEDRKRGMFMETLMTAATNSGKL